MLHRILVTALVAACLCSSAIGQQAPPQGHPLQPTLADCRSARNFLAGQMPLQFRDVSAAEMQEYERAMTLCSMAIEGTCTIT